MKYLATTFLLLVGCTTVNPHENEKSRAPAQAGNADISETAASLQCSSVDATALKVGLTCTTSKRIVFSVVAHKDFGLAWQDPKGGIWSLTSSRGDSTDTQALAIESCAKIKGRLPSYAEFENAEKNFGIHEVMRIQKYCYWAWTSETSAGGPSNTDNTWFFSCLGETPKLSMFYPGRKNDPPVQAGAECVPGNP